MGPEDRGLPLEYNYWTSDRDLKRRVKMEGSNDGSIDGGNGTVSVAKDDVVIDGLKRWLEKKDSTFLEWLESSDLDGEEECTPEEVQVLQGTVAKYELQLSAFGKALLTEEERASGNGETLVQSDLVERLDRLVEERDALRAEVARQGTLLENMQNDFKSSLANLSDDRSSLLLKEMELKERESRLESHIKEAESKSSGAKKKATKDLEKDLSDRYQAELKEKDERWRKRESDLKAQVAQLEKDLTKVTVDLKMKEDQLSMGSLSTPDAGDEIKKKMTELQSREKESLLIRAQLENLKADVAVKEEEVNRLRETINKKEEEMARREEEVQYKEKLLHADKSRFEDSKKEIIGVDQVEMRRKLEELGQEIKAKEAEVRTKEKWLNAKQEELRLRESGVIEDEIRTKQKEQLIELQQAKVKTGNTRLDDLLFGGIPIGSNIMVHGPPFIGKEVMVNGFIADGLKKGVPAIWLITDKTPRDVREEMKFVLSGYEEYEKKGLVRYIDTFSRKMGDDSQDPYTVYIKDPTDLEKISETVEEVCKELKDSAKYYRMALRSLSTMIAYSDPNAIFRFLSPLCGRRKRDQSVSMILVEKGMHSEQEIQMLGSVMDGMIDFKIDQMKTFFSVQGIADVQSRAYIRYTATKHNLNVGSFALDHIR